VLAQPEAPARAHPELVLQLGHSGAITSGAFSRDGARFVTAGGDHTIKVWEPATGLLWRTLHRHRAPVLAFSFSPDGKVLASADADGSVVLWDARTYLPLRTLTTRGGEEVESLAFSPDGRWLVVGSDVRTHMAGRLTLWEVRTGTAVREFAEHRDGVAAVAFSVDGKWIASADFDMEGARTLGKVHVWSTADGRRIRSLNGGEGWVQSIAFSPDSSRLTAAVGNVQSSPDRVKLWEMRSGQELHTLRVNDERLTSLAFSPDGKTLAVTGATVLLWDVPSRTTRGRLPTSGARGVTFSRDGKTLAAWGSSNAELWDPRKRQLHHILAGRNAGVVALSVSRSGTRLASGSTDKTARLWDLQTASLAQTLTGHESDVRGVALSPDGELLATAGWFDPSIHVRSTASGKILRTLTVSRHFGVTSLAFSPDGGQLAAAGGTYGYYNVTLWNPLSGALLGSHDEHGAGGLSGAAQAVAVSPDGRLIAADGLRVWDAQAPFGAAAVKWRRPGGRVAFSPDSRLLAAAEGAAVQLFEAHAGKLRSSFEVGTSFAAAVAFSPIDSTLAAGTGDGRIVTWAPMALEPGDQGKRAVDTTLHTTQGSVASLAVLPLQPIAVSGGGDGTIQFWDLGARKLLLTLLTLPGTSGQEEWLAFTPDGHYHGSPGSSHYIRWSKDGRLHPAAHFASEMHRPSQVARALRVLTPGGTRR
jgi:WD40 repeat protein